MPQDRETGDRARKWGFSMAQQVVSQLGASLINPKLSNEATLKNRKILIKSAHHRVPEIGATIATLDRIDAIVAALQDKDGLYTIYEVSPNWFRQEMMPSRNPKTSHVMMVRCARVREAGKVLGRIKEL